MRILLVQPLPGQVGPGQFLRSCVVEPLGINYLAGYLVADNQDVSVSHPLPCADDFLEAVRRTQPDVIGYSVYTFSLTEALAWAGLAKEHQPKVINVFGGYHPTGQPSVCMYPEVDYVVVGEGEKPMRALLHYLVTGVSSPDLAAVVSRATWEKGIRPTGVRLDTHELESFSPVRDPTFLDAARHYQLSCPPPSQQRSLAQVLYARGCPHGCSFCTSKKMWGGQIIRRSPERVVAEIAKLHDQYGTNLIFFADLCLNISREAILSLCDLLREARLGVSWWGLFRPEALDTELLERMVLAGCGKISVGIDHRAILDEDYQPSTHLGFREGILDSAHKLGLIVRGLLMIGLPWETEEYLMMLASRLAHSCDELRIAFCCPFPGTELWDEVQVGGLLLARSWSEMDTDRPVLHNRHISPKEYIDIRMRMLHSFLWNESLRRRVKSKTLQHPRLTQSYREFAEYLARHDIATPPEMTGTDNHLQATSLQDGFSTGSGTSILPVLPDGIG